MRWRAAVFADAARTAAGPLLALLLCAGPARAQDPVIAAAGDVACDPADANYNSGNGTPTACRMKATSDLLVAGGFDAVLPLGDLQYEDGVLAKFQASYDPSWGRVKPITRPVVGNHEYLISPGSGYYAYFGAAAGDPAKGWYSFDLGAWHVVVLNSNCSSIGGCGAGSPQETWLAADLAAHPGVCTLAAWHQPRFSSGNHGDDAAFDAFWRALYAAGADVVLNGHDHEYERFAPQTPEAALDTARGIREFVVGTGGKNQTPFPFVRANSEERSTGTFGILKLILHPASYDWEFVPAPPATYTDSGSAPCRRAPRPLAFHTLFPCRLADTRGAQGPALAAGSVRDFVAVGLCGVPASATALALNVTVVAPSGDGDLSLGPSGIAPGPGTLPFRAGQVRATFLVAGVGAYGSVAVRCGMPSGAAHVVVDVSGWFE